MIRMPKIKLLTKNIKIPLSNSFKTFPYPISKAKEDTKKERIIIKNLKKNKKKRKNMFRKITLI